MEADWFDDPLGRFEGRFFDGVTWTEQISDNGVLGIDPDWPPTEPVSTETEPAQVAAVATASVLVESPVRVVAIIDRAALAANAGAVENAHGRRRRRWHIAALLAALVAVAAASLIVGGSTDRTNDAVGAAPTGAALDEETPVPGTATAGPASPAGDAAPSPSAGATRPEVDSAPLADGGDLGDPEPDDGIAVGGLRIANGSAVLTELGVWHEAFAARRGLELGAEASCWFGRFGSAAMQDAFCGPVGGAADTAWLFDAVPLVFEDTGQGLIARPIVDAAAVDTSLPDGLELIGPIDPPAQLPARGERGSGG